MTPDSFSDGGQFSDIDTAVAHGLRLVEEGAGILDIGGESTRPGADMVPVQEELDRVIPVIEKLVAEAGADISIDTRKPEVARAAIAAGASIWNDVTALTYASDSVETAMELGCNIVLMHAQGDPKKMQDDPHYDDVVPEVFLYLAERVEACIDAGIEQQKIVVDPGIGFGKTLDHNLALLANLDRFSNIAPVLLGASRKRFIAAIDRDGPAKNRLGGSLAAAIAGAAKGVKIVRVHDVAETRQALKVFQAIENAR